MPDPLPPRLVVYRAVHPVEARQVAAYLRMRGIDGAEIEDRVFRARPMAGSGSLQDALDPSGYHVSVPPAHATEARTLLEDARKQKLSFLPDPSDMRPLY
jgi:hypothetical protein